MRRLLGVVGLVVLVALAGAAAGFLRPWLSERAPRRQLDGHGPIIGSLDTWPPVPRAPSTSGPAS